MSSRESRLPAETLLQCCVVNSLLSPRDRSRRQSQTLSLDSSVLTRGAYIKILHSGSFLSLNCGPLPSIYQLVLPFFQTTMLAHNEEDLEALAETCLSTARQIKQYLAANGHAAMTFDQSGPSFFPPTATPEIQHVRLDLRAAAKRLYDLASGPDEVLTWHSYHCVSCILSWATSRRKSQNRG